MMNVGKEAVLYQDGLDLLSFTDSSPKEIVTFFKLKISRLNSEITRLKEVNKQIIRDTPTIAIVNELEGIIKYLERKLEEREY